MNKDLIISLIKENPSNYMKLLEISKLDKEELSNILDTLVDEGIIKKAKVGGIYSIIDNSFSPNEFNDSVIEKIKLGYTNMKDLIKVLNCDKKLLNKALNELVKNKRIFVKFDKYCVPQDGRIKITESGKMKVVIDNIPYAFNIVNDVKFLFDGDIVTTFVLDNYYKDAYIGKLIKRGHDTVTGVLKKYKKKDTYYLRSKTDNFPVIVDVEFNGDFIPDMVYQADITYDDRAKKIYGYNLNYVGNLNDPGMEISLIALDYGFKLDFNDDVKNELLNIPSNVSDNDIKGRRDYRSLNIITIDGVDSKDFDDAIYLEKKEDKYLVSVHIADVSHYVRENTELDKEALSRGTSLYLADRVIPMLPHKLSNGICSLNPNEDRLVLTVDMEIGLNGKLLNYEIVEGVINSHHRMTYDDVNKIFNGDKELIEKYKDIYQMLLDMKELSQILRNIRTKRGGLEFDIDEYSFILNEDSSPKDIIKRTRDNAEMLIEDFMLLANETVAYHMNILGLPIVYRIHEKPDQDKLRSILEEISGMGISVKLTQNDIHPALLQKVLNNIKDSNNSNILANMVLRGMMKAKYSSECLGHYGLAMKYYCHFTSPIRRYPDLMTHRLIKKLLLHPSDNLLSDISEYNKILPVIAYKNSLSERASIDCERAVDDMLFAWYMEKNIGKIYKGLITGIESFGMFINIGNGIEGVFAYRNSDDYFDYDSKNRVAKTVNKTYCIGDIVNVRCVFASHEDKKIDFIIVGDSGENYLSK